MKRFKIITGVLTALMFVGCKAMNKTAINESNIPADVGNNKYKLLVIEIDFNNTVSKKVAGVHNKSAGSYVKKTLKELGEFISKAEMGKEKYEDRNVYRYALINETNTKLEKTYTYSNPSRSSQKTTSYITNFYFYDRLNGTKLPYAGSSTTALWMLKAIVDKAKAAYSR
jgi:hypothetical protein